MEDDGRGGIQPDSISDTYDTIIMVPLEKVIEDYRSVDETRIQPESTNDTCESDNIIEGGFTDIGTKRKGWDCSEDRPSQRGSSSHEGKPFVNLISDDDNESSGASLAEDSDTCIDSGGSLGDFIEMMTMEYRNQIKDNEIEWKCEADMLFSFEEDPEVCMKAVCALYRQQISGDETSAKGLFHYNDALRATTLDKFLMDGACHSDLKKSVKELGIFDSEAIEDCKRLARRYSKQLFSIYQNGTDPFFFTAMSASKGELL